MFRRNVGGFDRALRITLGVILLPVGLLLMTESFCFGWAIAGIGLIGLVTGIFAFCPPYVPFGISTARTKRSAPSRCQEAGTPAEGR